ncbi:MAG: hypothetical protein L3J91_00775, partial [Thermoplasmata archaeon]|nr:hypothetical protein [Thermoplasmata archaeon]
MAPRSAWAGSAAALLALTLLGSSAIASGGAALSPTVPPVSLPPPAAFPRALASPVAAASSPYLFVEGIEYESEEGEVAIPPANLIADFVLPSTTYPTAWSLSGLSST